MAHQKHWAVSTDDPTAAAANDSAAKVIAADAATRNDPLNALTL